TRSGQLPGRSLAPTIAILRGENSARTPASRCSGVRLGINSPLLQVLFYDVPLRAWRIIPVKRSNRYRLSRGPGEASGWYCTENTGLSLSAMPQFEPSNSDTWVSTAFAGRLARSTAKPWFIEVISTFPVVRSLTGWLAP